MSLLIISLGAAATATAGPPPEVKCGQSIVKEMAKCVKKVAGLHVKCYQAAGQPCAADEEKSVKALDKVRTSLISKCESDAAIADAGYGPLGRLQIAEHFQQACGWEARAAVDRAFGSDGSFYNNADEAGRKCLLNAAKTSSKVLTSVMKAHGKCIGKSCVPAETEADIAALEAKTAESVGKKCPDLDTLTGNTAEAFAAEITGQVASALAAPCDALDTTRCAFPFPNDFFSVPGAGTPSGHRVAIGSHSVAKTSPGGIAVKTGRWTEADGFSIGPMLLFQNTDIDLVQTGATPITDMAASLDPSAPVIIFDADTGEQQLLWVERDLRGDTVADQPLIIRVGRNLKEGHRYIVALRNMKDGGGAVLPASAGFALYRDNTPTTLLPVELRRAHMEDIFSKLTGFGIVRGDLYLAWDFTTQSSQSTAGALLHMRDDALDNVLAGAAPAFTVDSVSDPMDGKIFRQIDGTFEVPLYLTEGGIPLSTLRRDALGVPYNTGDTFTAEFRCLVPQSATTGGVAPAIPSRPSLYGHGLLGEHTEVSAGNVKDMSNEHNMIFCATEWTGFGDGDALAVLLILQDFSRFPNFIDRQHQGILNMIALGRLLTEANGFASDPAFQLGGDSLIDASELFYDGNSQGGILGGVVAAFSQDIERFSLGVPGINYSTLLNRSTDFEDFDDMLADSYPSSTDRNLLLSFAQLIWDRTDPSGHILHVTSDPYAGTPAKKLLYQVAFGDHQVAPLTAEIAARSNGMSIHTPTVSLAKVLSDVTPYYDIPAIPSYPFDGSALVIWDAGNPEPPLGNISPPLISPMDPEWLDLAPCAQSGTGGDPHSCPRKNPATRQQKSDFLQTGGAVTDVCGGAPCIVP